MNMSLYNTIIANGLLSEDCANYGVLTANIRNLIESSFYCGTPYLTTDPQLGSLGNNGGPTQTFALSPTSPAIDAGDNTHCPATDQRGITRPLGLYCDIGSYEAPYVPKVSSIVRAGTNPTNAASVDFTVTFNDNMTGVDTTDFVLTTTDDISGASITGLSGSGASYTVTVDTGSGDGTLRLDVTDDDSILDHESNPLGGTGAGNGDFTLGEAYTIDKTAPTVSSIVRAGTNPTNADSVDFTVTFSEGVTGVDATDFTLTITGGISGASVSGVSGTGATLTVTVNTGAGSGTLQLDVTDDDSIVDAASNPLGGTGAGNGNFTSIESYTIDKTAPSVTSIVRAESDPTAARLVDFTVTFSESVTGVDIADFTPTKTGAITGASVSSVSGTGITRTVTVNTGTGNGTLRLDIPASATITDLVGNPLSGLPFTGEQTYTVNKTLTFRSAGAYDGWVLESSETSNMGGTMSSTATTFYVGDNAQKKQYRGILSFNTAALPDTATITKVTLKLKLQGTAGANPFTTHGNLLVDVRKGPFGGANALRLGDFQATASKNSIGSLPKTPVSGWYTKNLSSAAFTYINPPGVTQFRRRFTKDDDNDAVADYLKFYSGDAGAAYQPQLIVEYYVP
jgi:hypothetical protein